MFFFEISADIIIRCRRFLFCVLRVKARCVRFFISSRLYRPLTDIGVSNRLTCILLFHMRLALFDTFSYSCVSLPEARII